MDLTPPVEAEPPVPDAAEAPPSPPTSVVDRAAAVFEVALCSDYPTQLLLATAFAAAGFVPSPGGVLSLPYVATLSLADTALLIGLIVLFLVSRGERPRDVLFGQAPLGDEMRAGVPLLFAAFGLAMMVMLATRLLAPSLHTVPDNPLQDLVDSPLDTVVFAVVLIVAGGIREEVQRAFLLTRFEQRLGGQTVGLIVSSALFGAGHIIQGADAAVTTAMLGAFWGSVYLRRRSIGATVVSHAGFNIVQVVQFLLLRR